MWTPTIFYFLPDLSEFLLLLLFVAFSSCFSNDLQEVLLQILYKLLLDS